jgi:GTP cyclohydrolase IA
VTTLIAKGLRTPGRVARAYKEWFAGYGENAEEFLQRTFEEVAGYDEIVLLRDVQFVSHCEHHNGPIVGPPHIGYLPTTRVVGVPSWSASSRCTPGDFRFQERLTAEIATALDRVLEPQGVAVVIEGTHGCMTSRGVSQREATMVTSRMLGAFREQPQTRQEFLSALALRRLD